MASVIKQPTSKRNRWLASIALAGLAMLLSCCITGAVSVYFTDPDYRYPNSIRMNFCPTNKPLILYEPQIPRFMLRLTDTACYSTSDSYFTVYQWYTSQNWTNIFPSSGYHFYGMQTYQAGPFKLLVLKEIYFPPSISTATEIHIATDYQLDIIRP